MYRRAHTKVKFTMTPSAAINKHDIQFCGSKKYTGFICYNDSYKDVFRGLIGSETIYLDLETGSYDSKLDSLNPWKNCWPIGAAICAEDYGNAYYIPINKSNENQVYDLLFELLNHDKLKRWVNHNIKYDFHVLLNAANITVPYSVQLVDTLTISKLIDSDRFRYSLDQLAKDWLTENGQDLYEEHDAAFKPYLRKNKDYSAIPYDIIGPYACKDVLITRELYKYINDNLPEECHYVRDIEIELTRILCEIEQNGLHVNPDTLSITEISNYAKLLQIEEKLEKITGKSFRPHTNADCLEILCSYYGLPILKWTNSAESESESESESDDGPPCNASFDKEAITAYLTHPTVVNNPNILQTVQLIAEYRKINTFNNLFIKKYKELIDSKGILHAQYNQCVRSGRMSCSKPNSQQLNTSAKRLILPYSEEELFVSYDFSQIEYRFIAHYIENPLLLQQYNENPDSDFHDFVVKLVKEQTGLEGMSRQSAKTLNFGLGFGMGKAKLLKSLQGNMDLMQSLMEELNNVENGKFLFSRESEKRAEKVYNTYHNTFPEMRRTSREAQSVCEYRGYIKNIYGRRRHLGKKFAYKAFNTVNQSSAADLMKDAMVRIGRDLIRTDERKIKIVASVHDEILFSMPKHLAEDTRITHTIAHYMENPERIKLKVPIRVAMGVADNWAEACKSATVRQYTNIISTKEFRDIIES